MRRGFMRIIETLLVITLMFTLMSSIVKGNPPIEQAKDIRSLQRYATDGKNMLCNSDQAKNIMTGPASMDWINSSLAYAMPENLRYSVTVFDAATGAFIKSTGYTQPSDTRDLATAGCTATYLGRDPVSVTVGVWI